ncbi:hypothetical protein F9L16_17630 [Agarivorans sp. B2Z047]|uniref:TcfC E-set like domain-containing protein n=1 Tax=Agarivorans sp. B2Z047 TaxID=2652721 RepID=UPI00128CB4D4|nr:TcfC E-set like domain-containing protein [Agarivorans sp. B2Z047]MPW30810.1 hypothetical protein [Agarivorans sp. B2Z047]UQN40960.1 TcfC E-set like domain-containing protein [Agarivorans sp. B2Z047]
MNFRIVSLVFLHMLSVRVYGNEGYPEGFEALFSIHPKEVKISIAGVNDYVKIGTLSNVDVMRVVPDTSDYQLVVDYLEANNISVSGQELILGNLVAGVSTDRECKVNLSSCVLSANDDTAKYIFDYDNQSLKIVPAVSFIETPNYEQEHYEAYASGYAIINWANLYGYSNFDNVSTGTLSNLTTVGLPLGHFLFDTEVGGSSSSFETYTAIYDADFDGYRIQGGVNKYDFSFNSTDLFNSGGNFNFDGVFVGSSRNLIKGGEKSQQRIYFYSPQLGQLEVYRDDRLILSKIVSEGQQFISYEDLPRGTYDITLLVKVAEQIVVSDSRQVANNSSFSLPSGSFDYVVGAGRLEGISDFSDRYDKESVYAARGAFAYRLMDSLLLGGASVLSNQQQLYQVGGNYVKGSRFGIDFVHSHFSNGDYHHQVNLRYAPFFVDARYYSSRRDQSSYNLSEHLYGEANYTDIGIGVSGQLYGSSTFVRANYYDYQYPDSEQDYSYEDSTWSISAGISKIMPYGTLGVNADYSISKLIRNDYRLALTWSMPLGGGGISTRFGIYHTEDGFDRASNYVKGDNQFGRWYGSVEAGGHIYGDRSVMADVSATLSGNTDHLNGNAYVYTDDTGERNISGTVSSGQIISRNGISFSNVQSQSYALVQAESNFEAKAESKTLSVSMTESGRYKQNADVETDKLKVVPLTSYKEFGFSFDASGNNVEVLSETKQHFSHPGSLVYVNASISTLDSQMLILDDLFGNPIQYAECVGPDCVSVERLSQDGVYRINYRPGKNYEVISTQGLCLWEESGLSDVHRGYCLPGIDESDVNKLSLAIDSGSIKDKRDMFGAILYLGRHVQGPEYLEMERVYQNYGFDVKSIQLGDYVYSFILNANLTTEQFEALIGMDVYIVMTGTEDDFLATVIEGLDEVYEP